MAKRKGIGPKLRFEILKRDRFLCCYCGRKPPEITLVVDHIAPVALGGGDNPRNLITACVDCNSGKGDRPLRMMPPLSPPDPLEGTWAFKELWMAVEKHGPFVFNLQSKSHEWGTVVIAVEVNAGRGPRLDAVFDAIYNRACAVFGVDDAAYLEYALQCRHEEYLARSQLMAVTP